MGFMRLVLELAFRIWVGEIRFGIVYLVLFLWCCVLWIFGISSWKGRLVLLGFIF